MVIRKKKGISVARSGSAVTPAQRNQALGAFLKSKRLEAKRTEQEVAQYLGLSSPRLLQAYESGMEKIPLNRIYALSNCLNIDPVEIMELLHRLALR